MKHHKVIYISALLMFLFALVATIKYWINVNFGAEIHKPALVEKTQKEKQDDIQKAKIDTVYQKELAKQTALENIEDIKNYIEDTLAPALAEQNEKVVVTVPVYIPVFDSIAYYKWIADSAKKQGNLYRDRYTNIVFNPKSDNDSAVFQASDSTINFFVKNRWQYQKGILGLPVSREGYTDIYTNINKPPYSFKQNQPLFGVRLQTGTVYNFSLKELKAGLSLRFDAKSYQGVLSYYYNLQGHEWQPAIGFYKDLIRIH